MGLPFTIVQGTVFIADENGNLVKVSENKEIRSSDILDNGGIDTDIPLTATAKELRVGTSSKALRKFIMIQALSNNVVFGFTQTSQSFQLRKIQTAILPFGPDTKIWAKVTTGTGSIAVGEVS